MVTQAQADRYYTSLLKKYVEVKIDPDGMYGCQCKDVPDRWGMDLYDKPLFATVPAGDAKTVAYNYNSEYFTRIENRAGDMSSVPRLGDVIIWDGNENNPYGHIAIVSSATPYKVTVVQQDGFAAPLKYVNGGWYSDKPAHWAVLSYDNWGTGPALYWLRPRLDKIKIPASLAPAVTSASKPTGGVKKYSTEHHPTGFQVSRSYYGYGAKPDGVTVHHWGIDGQNRRDVQRFLCDTTRPARVANPTSAHEVISDGVVDVLAPWDKATYHAGSTRGNGTTIGLECRPEMSVGDLATVVARIADIEKQLGSMDVYLHRDWFPTACPGRYEAKRNEIVTRVNAIHKTGLDPMLAGLGATTAIPEMTNALEELLNMSQTDFDRDKKRAGTAAWYIANNRDRGLNIEKRLKTVEGIIRGMPLSVMGYRNPKVSKTDDAYAWLQKAAQAAELAPRIDALEKKLDAVLAALTEGK